MRKVVITGIGGKNKVNDARMKLKELLKFMKMDVLEESVGFAVNNEAWVNNKVLLTNDQKEEINSFIEKIKEFIK